MAVYNKLTPHFVRSVQHTGITRNGEPKTTDERHTDGHGLMLCVKPSGAKSWVQSIVIEGKRRTFGLGGYPLVSLKEAREIAFENRKVARSGGNPLAHKQGREIPTFSAAAEIVIAIQKAGWKNAGKSEAQWLSSLSQYAFPFIGTKRVDAITTPDILAALLPIWQTKRETASRVRQRISAVMKWAVASKFRPDDPAGPPLLAVLPKGGAPTKRHHAALPHVEVGAALHTIRASCAWPGTKLAFEWLVLTAARSGEVRGARWDEIDGDIWTIPADRMKMNVPHRVPLSRQCMAILDAATSFRDGELIFPSSRGRALSDATISKLLREHGVKAVPHGFRSSFRDWASECTETPRDIMESALAHSNRNKVEAAYARSDLLERRRVLMQGWADYVSQVLELPLP